MSQTDIIKNKIKKRKTGLNENALQLKNYCTIRVYSDFLLSFVLIFVLSCILSLFKEANNNKNVSFKENPSSLCILILSLFCSLFIIYKLYEGIKYLILFLKFKKDSQENESSRIHETPSKVYISQNKKIEDSSNNIMLITLKFNKVKLIIPYVNQENFKKMDNKIECCESLKKISSKLKYLKNSKVVVLGEDKYILEIKEFINANKSE